MIATPLDIPDVVLLEPRVFADDRGHFFESFNAAVLQTLIGRDLHFVQDNESRSARGVLRGLHYQVGRTQGKLVRVVSGEVFDVAVDIRRGSPTFGRHVGVHLSGENKRQIWIPEGFAHGFLVLSDAATCQYKVTDYWSPEHERCIRFDDADLAIPWPPVTGESGEPMAPRLSAKDGAGHSLARAELL
jgi:dTDP-4-dehydrorhamnose 3,5-epimerase